MGPRATNFPFVFLSSWLRSHFSQGELFACVARNVADCGQNLDKPTHKKQEPCDAHTQPLKAEAVRGEHSFPSPELAREKWPELVRSTPS